MLKHQDPVVAALGRYRETCPDPGPERARARDRFWEEYRRLVRDEHEARWSTAVGSEAKQRWLQSLHQAREWLLQDIELLEARGC